MTRATAGRRRSRLVRAGLDAERAVTELVDAGLLPDADADLAAVEDLLVPVSLSASPDWSLQTLARLAVHQPALFAAVRTAPDWLGRIAAVGGASRPLGELLAQHADAVQSLDNLAPTTVEDITTRVREALTGSEDLPIDERASRIAVIRRRATADIAARDLTGAVEVEGVARELSALAEGVLAGTLAALLGDDAPARIAVIGMGKLGGRELNYVSDVDVMFVHEPVAGADEAAATAVAITTCEQLLALLNASTTMGRAYEVDPTLRPEGRHGALSRTPASFQAYWERWAKTWEFQALIKARPVAGDHDLGQEFLARSAPFVWPDRLDPGVVGEVRRMKGRVESKPEVRRHGARQVKLGPGGLRDIEFAVQLLQLVHGRADPELRLPGTLPTLRALAEGGYVADEDAEAFSQAYRFLRRIEHRLQLANERRTHTIPDDEASQERLARSMAYFPTPDRAAREVFATDLRGTQAVVRDLHAKLFYRPLLESHAAVHVDDAGLARRGMDDAAARERLSALGFEDAAGALASVRALSGGMSRSARAVQVVLPAFLHELQDAPDADLGLRRFRDLVEALADNTAFVARLRDHPPTVAGLARVLGTSQVVADLLVDQPQGMEWFDADARASALGLDDAREQALARLQWQDPMDAMRRLKRHLLLRVALRDLLGDEPVGVIGQELTAIGEACLVAGLRAVLTDLAMERGDSRPEDLPFRMAVIGMGKLGGRELHYPSDLDVMFVHEPVAGADRSAVHGLATKAAEALLRTLGAVTAEGTAFEVDADLRPEGRRGPLSRSLESFSAYYDRWSEPWEHQALLRARPVAGDPELGARLMERARLLAYPTGFGEADAVRMRRMKARLEKERIRRRHDPKRHLKLGPGGLSDIEWTVQLLQQRHGADAPSLRTPNTMRALDGAQDAGLIGHRDATWLRDGFHFLGRVRNRLYLMKERNVDLLPTAAPTLARLAHGLGYGRGGRQEFEDDHLRHTRRVRQVAERVFYDIEPPVEGWTRG